jgi:hypothetical protein
VHNNERAAIYYRRAKTNFSFTASNFVFGNFTPLCYELRAQRVTGVQNKHLIFSQTQLFDVFDAFLTPWGMPRARKS